jgi:hypothetical protein
MKNDNVKCKMKKLFYILIFTFLITRTGLLHNSKFARALRLWND